MQNMNSNEDCIKKNQLFFIIALIMHFIFIEWKVYLKSQEKLDQSKSLVFKGSAWLRRICATSS